MSKLVYRSINEIINKKFINEFSGSLTDKPIIGGGSQSASEKQFNRARATRIGAEEEQISAAEAEAKATLRLTQERKKKTQLAKVGEKQRANMIAASFDPQAVPGMPPVGMPPTAAPAPPPASMLKPAGAPNYEGGHMTKTQLCQAHEACSNLMASIEDYDSLPDWLKGKITLAADYLVKCESFVNAKDQEHEDSQDEHMPKGPESGMPGPSPMKPPMGGSPLMGISLGRVQSVSPGE